MSKYTVDYLANNVKASTLHGRPWWARLGVDYDNLYDGPVPFGDVYEMLAGWEPTTSRMLDEERVIEIIREGHAGADLIQEIEASRVESHKLVKTPEGQDVIGLEHMLHLYGPWIMDTIQIVLGDDVQILSCGNLDRKMQAWVCVARPEPEHGPAGIDFSPMITFSTSYNGTLSTNINQNFTLPICDNTSTLARSQGTAFKHTAGSLGKLGTYRSVAEALVKGATDFRAVLETLTTADVSDKDYSKFLDRYLPVDEEKDGTRRKNRVQRVKQEITQLYKADPRVAEWHGKAFGLLQAVNTWEQHQGVIRNTTGDNQIDDTNLRAMKVYGERMRPLKAKAETNDEKVLRLLDDTLTDSGHRKLFAMA